MDPRLDNKKEESNLSTINNLNENSSLANPYTHVTPEEPQPPFQSRFKSWIRIVALAIVIVFVPEQISWAFSYNPLVLWGKYINQNGIVPPSPINAASRP